ncbi:MAG: AMP-binding protein, partial [Lentihominibacter sp.]|nr:AMP-binding protein [Lentihominibacter sp.]
YEKLYRTIWKNVRKQGKEKLLKKVIKVNRVTRKFGIDLGNKFFGEIRAIFGGRMKTLICGGAKIDPEILDGLRDFGFNALQGYGLTEAAPMGAFNPQDAPNSRSVGVPFPGQEIKTVNANEEGIGEICIRGENLMMGYFHDPEETARVIDSEGWFHTGDLGYVDSDGYAYLTGRAKNVIITKNGKNVYPEEIEYQLGLLPFVAESFVFEDTNAAGNDTVIVASVKVDEEEVRELIGEDFSDEDLKKLIWTHVDEINDSAPPYRRIRKVILRKKDFVHNTSSKLIRFAEENKTEE